MKPASDPQRPVLAVDLDGTLLRGDLLAEGLIRLFLPKFWRIPSALGWLIQGGPSLVKAKVAASAPLDGACLPWNNDVVRFCEKWQADGGRVVLATAADAGAAAAATRHFPFIDRVLGSTAGDNLKGARKAARLREEFGDAGFDYIGDNEADLPVWQAAHHSHFVGTDAAREKLERRLGKPLPAAVAPAAATGWPGWKALRPHQWLKNLLVFFPLCTAHRWTDPLCWQQTLPVFFALCCLASAAYLLNDLADLDADRAHPRKRGRPFASGAWSIADGLVAAACLFALGIALAALSGPAALAATAGYFALSLLYSLVIKTIPVFDGLFLSGLYTYRMVLGGIAGGVMISPWLLAFSTTFFLGLAFLKRFVELANLPLGADAPLARRGYAREDIGFVQTVGVASGFLSVVVLALYLDSSASQALYRAPQSLWVIALVLLVWIMRVWFLAGRKIMHDDPVWFAAKDRVTWIMGLVCVLAAGAAKPL